MTIRGRKWAWYRLTQEGLVEWFKTKSVMKLNAYIEVQYSFTPNYSEATKYQTQEIAQAALRTAQYNKFQDSVQLSYAGLILEQRTATKEKEIVGVYTG